MDVDGDVVMMDKRQSAKQCFSPIQNRKLASSSGQIPSACSLCPSMDLIVLAIGEALWIHRTVSWQRLATWKQEDVQVCTVCWSPDGRSLAFALTDGTVALHHVEALSSEEETGPMHTIALKNVVFLNWAHVGRPHPTWVPTDEEMLQQATWCYQSRYLDRASTFLPPSSYHVPQEGGEPVSVATKMRPSCQTPLSLLCAATSDEKIHLYLHGRYAIASLRCPGCAVSMVCTSDLKHVLVQTSSSHLTLYSLPALHQHRYSLQVVSALYCSITSHLQAIQQSIKEVAGAWKSSLKPLDLKLEGLKRNLTNYGVVKDIRSVLHQFILVGSKEDHPSTSAMDQFFQNVQMNDLLIQRLESSLHNAVSNVETLARKGLLSPARSLAYETGDLPCELLQGSHSLQQASHVLVLTMEDLVQQIIDARFRLRDLVSWLRSAGSQIKARGTAPNSAQRDNAKKRRVAHAVVRRMAEYLEKPCTGKGESITESLIGISISEFFAHNQNYITARRPMSPKCVDIVENLPLGLKRPTVIFAARRTRELMDALFEQPREFVSKSITQTDITISPASNESGIPVCAINTRIGRDAPTSDRDDTDANGEVGNFFKPKIVSGDESWTCYRHWSIIARAARFGDHNDSVHIFALPLGSAGEDDEQTCHVPCYLGARLVLPSSYRVKEISFYGDDGNSSLSAGTESDATGQEGRQSIGLLVSCPVKEQELDLISEELWLIRYDHVVFEHVAIPSPGGADQSPVDLDERLISGASTIHVEPLHESENEGADDQAVVYAKTRQVSNQQTKLQSHLLLSGSRGVGGVLISAPSHVELDLFDLEEDEEGSDDEVQNAE